MAGEFLKAGGDEGCGVLNFDWSQDEESIFTKQWLQWCRKCQTVKCVEFEVPAGILPQGCKGVLIDVKVFAKNGPDDKLYATSPELRDKVARGNCVLELNRIGNNGCITATKYIFLIFALKKFSGGMGDEDDSPGYQNQWQNYFIQSSESAVKVVSTKKANGEAAHASSRKLFGINYFCVGSKNVHLLVKEKHDINKYNDGRFLVARTVAETFFRQVLENENQNVENLIEFLQKEKCTMVHEILQPAYQHVENLSYLEHPELLFICWTNYSMISDDSSLCPTPPNLAIDKARNFGLSTVDYEIIDANEVEKYMAKIRSEFEYEGRVLYFLDSNDNVIGVLKKKTAWYIILRAVREKICHFLSAKTSLSNDEKRTKITKRIAEIQTWIGFSDEYKTNWTKLAVEFVRWLSIMKGRPEGVAIRAQFPNLWKSFLESDESMKSIYSNLENNFS